MHQQQRLTIDAASEYFRSQSDVLALILGGSLAKGTETDVSDVDVMVVLTPDAFAKRKQEKTFAEVIWDLATYDGGYVDVKYIDYNFLSLAAEKASEPTRDSFTNAQVLWSDIPQLEALVAKIPVYPVSEKEEKIRRFYSACIVQTFFIKEAENRNDPFLANYAASTMVLLAARLILAHNEMLFPSNKRMMERVATAVDKPTDFMESLLALLKSPTSINAQALKKLITDYRDWGIDWNAALGQYTEDSEFNWLDNPPPLLES
jgi:predicted nucleotidyltransferase